MTLFMSNTVQPLDNPIVIQPSLISGGDNHYQAHQEMSFVMKSRCESGSQCAGNSPSATFWA